MRAIVQIDEGIFEHPALEFIDVVANDLGVGGDDGAVVVIGGGFDFVLFVRHAWIKDKIGVLPDEPCDVPVGEFGGITCGFGRNGVDAHFVNLFGRLWGQNDAESQLGKEGEPEGIVFVHVENARDPDRSSRGLFGRERGVVERASGLVGKQVWHVGFVDFPHGAFASVARHESLAVLECVDGEEAVVLATAATAHGNGVRKIVE